MTDHPRACGENNDMKLSLRHFQGSPPRVRGKRIHGRFLRFLHGITPARAGKTARLMPSSALYADHPRACGENLTDPHNCTACPGSPPRVRGKHDERYVTTEENRITPARAGKTV